jgi:hypothetical protein
MCLINEQIELLMLLRDVFNKLEVIKPHQLLRLLWHLQLLQLKLIQHLLPEPPLPLIQHLLQMQLVKEKWANQQEQHLPLQQTQEK